MRRSRPSPLWSRRLTVVVPMALLLSAGHAHAGARLIVPTQFATIQDAVDAAVPGDTVVVRQGTYVGQVVIDKDLTLRGAGSEATNLQSPSQLVPFGWSMLGRPRSALLLVTSGATVRISGITVSGPLPGICDPARPSRLLQYAFGVAVNRQANLTLTDSKVTRIRAEPLGACFSGFAIGVGTPPFEVAPDEDPAGHATISNVTVDDYQRVGIGVTGSGSTATVRGNTVVGAGQTGATVQSGIVVTFGASGRITENVVSGNLCAIAYCGPDYLNQVQSFGIVLGEAAPDTVVAENTVFGNDVGIDVEYSDASTAVRENWLTNNRYFGITLLDGTYTLTENRIRGGMVGVVVAALTMDTVAVLCENRIADVSAAPVLELPSWGFSATAIVRKE